jgi:hypothetical protein
MFGQGAEPTADHSELATLQQKFSADRALVIAQQQRRFLRASIAA